jgi:hypothetical protein
MAQPSVGGRVNTSPRELVEKLAWIDLASDHFLRCGSLSER